MDDWQPTRIVVAAEFVGRFLTVRVAHAVRGSSPTLILRVTPESGPDIDNWPYAQWDSRRHIPVPAGWDKDVNPWSAFRYSGLPKESAPSPAELEQIARDASSDISATKITALIDEHVDTSDLSAAARSALSTFFAADFDEVRCTALVLGDAESETGELTLASAQNLHQALVAGEPLDERRLRQAEVLLKHAPWQFGYWGPFKALVKSVPVNELANAYAVAVARLSRAEPTSSEPSSASIEDLDVLKPLLGLPSKRTRTYLARRVRRDLAALAKTSPDAYAKVASQMLIAWDEPLSHDAYAPAFVMLGARSPLDDNSDYVQFPADMSVRRDPHPEIWNERPHLALSVFTSVRESVEALTWAFQVMEYVDAVPPLTPDAIGLALKSTYPPLQRAGFASLPQYPEIFDSLTRTQWIAFFEGATDDEVVQVADSLMQTDPLPEAVPAAFVDVLVGADAASDRRARIALLYFAAQEKRSSQRPDADVAALIVAIENFQLEYQAEWNPILDRLRPQALLAVYEALALGSGNDAALDVIDAAVLQKHWMAAGLALECISSEHQKLIDLGWRLVDAQGGTQFLFERVLSRSWRPGQLRDAVALRVLTRALPRAENTQHVTKATEWALSVGLDPSEIANLLIVNSFGRIALWEMLGDGVDERAVGTTQLAYTSADVIRAVGEMLDAQQLSRAAPPQLTFALRYITENTARIAQDAPFGLVALWTANPHLQAEALSQLRSGGHIPTVWFTLAQSENADAVEAAREYIAALSDASQIRDAVLACLHSEVHVARNLGLEMFRARRPLLHDRTVWNALAELDDHRAQEWVAEAALERNPMSEGSLAAFDRRLLTERRHSERARSLVKQRLERAPRTISSAVDERISGLLELARGEIADDREWALMTLAAVVLSGVHIEGFEVSLTTEGTVAVGDIS